MAEQTKKDQGMTVQEAGRKGGETTKREYGPDFYETIGSKGGETTKRRYGPDFYSKIGRQGGRKQRKNQKGS